MQNGKTSGSQEIPHSSNQFGYDPGMGEFSAFYDNIQVMKNVRGLSFSSGF